MLLNMMLSLDILSTETWVLVIIGVILLRVYIYKRWQYLKNLDIPHDPPTILGLGHLGEFLKDPDSVFTKDNERMKKFGSIYGTYSCLTPSLVISDTAILQQIFTKYFSNFHERDNITVRLLGKEFISSVICAKGDQWKRIRSTLTPTFSDGKVKQMAEIIEDCGDSLVETLRKTVVENNGRFLAQKVLSRYALDVICSTVFSSNLHSQKNEKPKIAVMAEKMCSNSYESNPVSLLIFLFPWFSVLLEKINYSFFPIDAVSYYRKLIDTLISKKNEDSAKQRVDLMQHMLRSRVPDEQIKNGATKGLTRDEITGNAMVLLLAGYDTTANALVFLAYNLAINKSAQRKLKQEIQEQIQQHGKLTYDAMNKMEYLTMCINESLRLYTPVARLTRMCERDITINGLFIPKGITVEIPAYALAHDEEYWDQPFEFKPERMADMSQIDPMMLVPFGAGPRNCIGMQFSLAEMKIGICKILQEFDLDVCSDTPPSPLEVTCVSPLKPKMEVYLKVVPCQS